MNRRATVRIPAEQAAGVVDALLAMYARHAHAVAATARAYRTANGPLDALADARRELIETEDALDDVGWERGPRREEIELGGPTGAVREALYASLLAAAESAQAACRNYEHGRITRTELAVAIGQVAAVHDLFAALENADAPDST
jgi:hypothetical protein